VPFPENLVDWTKEDVYRLLTQIYDVDPNLASLLYDKDINGITFAYLDDATLLARGIEQPEHRRKIVDIINSTFLMKE